MPSASGARSDDTQTQNILVPPASDESEALTGQGSGTERLNGSSAARRGNSLNVPEFGSRGTRTSPDETLVDALGPSLTTRARSRTIHSIFDTTPYSPLPNVKNGNGNVQPANRPRRGSTTSSTAGRNRGRVNSISSGGEGVPVGVVIPSPPTSPQGARRAGGLGRPRRGTISSLCEEGRGSDSKEWEILPTREQDVIMNKTQQQEDHHAEMEEHHHDSVVDHLDVVGECTA